jgi:hypothetical protein
MIDSSLFTSDIIFVQLFSRFNNTLGLDNSRVDHLCDKHNTGNTGPGFDAAISRYASYELSID